MARLLAPLPPAIDAGTIQSRSAAAASKKLTGGELANVSRLSLNLFRAEHNVLWDSESYDSV